MSHGHDDHGHAAAATESHGPAELPPVPSPRSISPAREDFEAPWPGARLVSPVVWAVVALLFFGAARAFGHRIGEHDAEAHAEGSGVEAPHGEPSLHGEPAPHGGPAMGEETR